MHRAFALLLMIAAAAPAQRTPLPSPAPAPRPYDPAADYITQGQDMAGYQAWLAAAGWRPDYVKSFDSYLAAHGVGGIVPTWQLLRTATMWKRCAAEPFEMPPPAQWPHLVETLRYVRDHVVPVVGPVEPVSVYRNPALNACAGGAADSAHKDLFAVDMVPLRPTTRDALMRGLCAIHAWQGGGSDVGLGFYAKLRFHIDSKKYRKWGAALGDEVTIGCPQVRAAIAAEAAASKAAIAARTAIAPAAPETPPAPAPLPAVAP
jgi:hypothetical protein